MKAKNKGKIVDKFYAQQIYYYLLAHTDDVSHSPWFMVDNYFELHYFPKSF